MEQLWKSGREGSLCPLEQLRALAFRGVYKAHPEAVPEQGGLPALNSTIAGRLTLVGEGHPCKEAVRQLFERSDGDKDWYPGKRAAATYGPKPALSDPRARHASPLTPRRLLHGAFLLRPASTGGARLLSGCFAGGA